MLYEFEKQSFHLCYKGAVPGCLSLLAGFLDALHSCAREMLELFVPELKGRPFTLKDVGRQAGHIDVLLTAELAGTTYKIIVEDKTYTSEHNNQLLRYKEEIQEKFPGCIPCGVYYKTGFQSDLSAVHKAKYQYVSLEKMLDLLGRYVEKTDSQILRDYYGYWNTYLENARRYRDPMHLLFRCPAER